MKISPTNNNHKENENNTNKEKVQNQNIPRITIQNLRFKEDDQKM